MMQGERWMNQGANVIRVLMQLNVDCCYYYRFLIVLVGDIVVAVDCSDDGVGGYKMMSE